MQSFSRPVLFAVLLVVLSAVSARAQARLTVVNQSSREMSVKIMRVGGDEDTLHGRMSIPPQSRRTMTFSETGTYYAKTMATRFGEDPIFQRGQPFAVYVGRDGYSVLTLTFTITESAVPQIAGGRAISKNEFDKDSTPHR